MTQITSILPLELDGIGFGVRGRTLLDGIGLRLDSGADN